MQPPLRLKRRMLPRASFRDRFFTRQTAQAIAAPSSIVTAGAGTAAGVLLWGLSLPAAVLGAVAYGGWVLARMPRDPRTAGVVVESPSFSGTLDLVLARQIDGLELERLRVDRQRACVDVVAYLHGLVLEDVVEHAQIALDLCHGRAAAHAVFQAGDVGRGPRAAPLARPHALHRAAPQRPPPPDEPAHQ